MLYALNPTHVVRFISLVTLVTALAVVWPLSHESAAKLWHAKTLILAGPSLVILLLTAPPVFRWAHRLSFARLWWFPLLDGEWEGEIHSNWATIKTMLEAASGQRSRFNPLTDELPADVDRAPVRVTARIESALLSVRITLTMSETRRSRTIFVKPEKQRGEPPRLYYVYEQQEDGRVEVTDLHHHQGAAYLDFDSQTQTLTGAYWTERQGARGLNTAGTIRLMKVKKKATANAGA